MRNLMEGKSKKTSFMHGEISKLMDKGPSKGPLKGQKFTHKRAVAAALNVARKKGYKVGPARDGKDENMAASVFDKFISEGKMPAAFAKFIKGKKDKGDKKKADDGDDACDESASVFDKIVAESNGSAPLKLLAKTQVESSTFDQFTTPAPSGSAFDQFVKNESVDHDEKLAKTLALTESLTELKKKALGS